MYNYKVFDLDGITWLGLMVSILDEMALVKSTLIGRPYILVMGSVGENLGELQVSYK